MDTQKFNAEDARRSNTAVEQIRTILGNMPIAVAVSIVDIVRDDVHRQLQYGHAGFAVKEPAPSKEFGPAPVIQNTNL